MRHEGGAAVKLESSVNEALSIVMSPPTRQGPCSERDIGGEPVTNGWGYLIEASLRTTAEGLKVS